MNIERSVWFLNRLRAMGLAEILSRCRSEGLSTLQRCGLLLVTDPALDQADDFVPLLFELEPDIDITAAVRVADKLIDEGMDVFNLSGVECCKPEWNRDPLTGTMAPLDFGKQLNFKNYALCGDIKYLWEPGRFLQAVPLAIAWKVSADRKYLVVLKSMLSSWLEQCPYMMGVHWASPLELGIRLINWAHAWHYAGGMFSPMFEGEQGQIFRDRWLKSIYQHIHYIDGSYSHGSSANNHLIGEAAGAFIACCVWPFEGRDDRWKSKALGILEQEIQRQVHPDGVNKEQALAYQQFVLEFFRLAYLFDPISFSSFYRDQMDKMGVFIAVMSDSAGNSPMIGDADDGVVSGLSLLNQAPPVTGEIKTENLPDSYPDGGYHILRDEQSDLFMVIDSGPLGYGPLAAHGHADALSIYLALNGREFLIDPGTYVYGADSFWRSYFKGTSAHNTVRVDGVDQSESAGDFLWKTHAHTQGNVERGTVKDVFYGTHDGYMRFFDPVLHSRKVSLDRERKCITVSDLLDCKGSHVAEQFWHFNEKCQLEIVAENRVEVDNSGIKICMEFCPDVNLALFEGDGRIPLGWVSRRFGVRIPTITLVALGNVAGETVFKMNIFY